MRSIVQKYKTTIVLILSLVVSEVVYAQFTIPPKPSDSKQYFVYDDVKLLSPSEASRLDQKLTRYADTTSTQIVIALIESTKGEDISMLGARWGQQWGVGQANEDNGIMIILAKNDRTIDINTGYGIEYRITDRMAEQVINNYMIPEFKKGNFYRGLDEGIDVIIEMLAGEFKGTRKQKKSNFPYERIIIFAIFLLFWIILITRSRRGGGRNGGSDGGLGTLLDVIILSNAGRTSGGGSYRGGGGFGGGGFSGGGGFGGGGFGGGGASGSW